jgi:hypothetical protein
MPRRDAGPSVRSPSRDPHYVGNIPFARLVKSQTVYQEIAKAGNDPPGVVRNSVSVNNCVSWHAPEQCFEFCERCVDNVPHEGEEAAAFNAWCDLAYV